jgi:hypothetical protein
MQASDKTPDRSDTEQTAQTHDTGKSKRPGMIADDRPGGQRARRAADWGKKKYSGSWAEYLWHELVESP